MAKEWEKQIDKVCARIVCKTKEYILSKKHGTKLCGNYGKKKVFWKIVLKNWQEELGGKIV